MRDFQPHLTFLLLLGSLLCQSLILTAQGPKQVPPKLRIGLIADPQYCDCPSLYRRHSASTLSKMMTATQVLNEESVDLVISLGDVVDQEIVSFGPIMEIYRRLEMPSFHILGNHDFYMVPHAMKSGIIDSLEMTDYYCSMEVKGWKFILLDGTELGEYAIAAHRELEEESIGLFESIQGQENAQIWNGGISQKQLGWLRKELEESEARDQPVLVFCHFPITPLKSGSTLWNDGEMLDLLTEFPTVQGYICGHRHQGGYQVVDGLHLLTVEGLVLDTDSTAFGVLELHEDRMNLQGFGRVKSRTLPFRKDMQKGAKSEVSKARQVDPSDSSLVADSLVLSDPSGSVVCEAGPFERSAPIPAGFFVKKTFLKGLPEIAPLWVVPNFPSAPKSAPRRIRRRFFYKEELK